MKYTAIEDSYFKLPDETLKKASVLIPRLLNLLNEFGAKIEEDALYKGWSVVVDDFLFYFPSEDLSRAKVLKASNWSEVGELVLGEVAR